MMSKQTRGWVWTLSAEERLAAAVVTLARSDSDPVSPRLKRTYKAMLEKQRKLLLRRSVWPGAAAAGGHQR